MTGNFRRRAEFIWRPRGLERIAFSTAAPRVPEETNRFVHFRRTFDLAAPCASALVHATADGRYQLFVNGVLVGRGPVRSSAALRFVDPWDLAPYLFVGRNVIAVLAHSYGRNTAWYELPGWDHARAFGCGGFFLQGDIVTSPGTLRVDTDQHWKCRAADAWLRDVPSNSLGFSEVYDARRAPQGWNEADFDDATWESAEMLRVAGRQYTGDVRPFQYLLERDIPAQREGPVVHGVAIACSEVVNADGGADVAAQMEREAPLRPTACRINGAHDVIETHGERAGSIVYDFGEVVAGYIRFDLDGPAGAIVDFYPGEQRLDDGRVRIFDGIAGFDPPLAHRYVLREGRQQWERFEWNGLRYLQVTFRHCIRPLQVHAVAVNRTGYPLAPRGEFSCSDPLLTRIWAAGAKTLALCMHDAFIDCPSREQRQWMDAYLDARINYAAFGDTALAACLVRQIARSQRPDGLTMMAAPGDFAVACFTNIPDFSLLWILAIGDCLTYADDPSLADDVYPSMARALQWFAHHLNDEDLLTDVPQWVFIDWAELDKHGQVTALNALYVAALRTAAVVANQVGHARAATAYEATADRVAAAINRLLWDEPRGVYVDARRDGRPSRRVSQQSNAAAIAFGVAPRERWDRIFAAILDESRLVLTYALGHDGNSTNFDEEAKVVRAQPFYSHFLHRALRTAGRVEAIVDNIRTHWAALLDDGEATLRETWQLEPMTSKCHAWSGTPTFDLSTEVLGVAPAAPGFRRLRIAPQIAGLRWANGRYPTPLGDVQVAWTFADGRFELKLDMPADCEAEIVCPLAAWSTLDGATVGGASVTARGGAHALTALSA